MVAIFTSILSEGGEGEGATMVVAIFTCIL
jgi:hypothetical protein